MIRGKGAIQRFTKAKQPGAPFAPGSADNGLSVDPVSGRIVLGNDVTGVPGTARLLSSREISMSGFNINFINPLNSPLFNQSLKIDGNTLIVQENTSAFPAGVFVVRSVRSYTIQGGAGGVVVQHNVGVDDTNTLEIGYARTATSSGYRDGSFINARGTTALNLFVNSEGNTTFTTGNANPNSAAIRQTILSTGQVLIGASQVDNGLSAILQVQGRFSSTSGIVSTSTTFPSGGFVSNTPATFYVVHAGGNYGSSITRAANDTGGANFTFYKTRNIDAAIRTSVTNNDDLFNINVMGVCSDNSTVNIATQINSIVTNVNATFLEGLLNFRTRNSAGVLASRLQINSTGDVSILTGDLIFGTFGKKIIIPVGANSSAGTSGALVAGTLTIATTAVTAASLIFLTYNTPAGVVGSLNSANIVAGVSFDIVSSSVLDTSTVNWWIIN